MSPQIRVAPNEGALVTKETTYGGRIRLTSGVDGSSHGSDP
jgi:hypothetical protein